MKGITFYLFIFDLACCTAAEDKNYRGFNKLTIDILDVHDCFSGYFTTKKPSRLKAVRK